MAGDPRDTRDYVLWVLGVCLLILAAAGALATIPAMTQR